MPDKLWDCGSEATHTELRQAPVCVPRPDIQLDQEALGRLSSEEKEAFLHSIPRGNTIFRLNPHTSAVSPPPWIILEVGGCE